MTYTVAIRLKIPDNAAYTTLTTLRRLGVDVTLVERSDIVRVEAPSAEAAAQIVRGDEAIFNPNKHRLTVVEGNRPRAGEAWIEQDSRIVAWRLYAARNQPVPYETLHAACDRLLCNSAVETAVLHGDVSPVLRQAQDDKFDR